MHYKSKGFFIKSFVLIVLCVNLVYGQNQGTSSIQFLKIIPSAKMMSMGEAGVAIPDNAESVFINPAGLAKVAHLDARLSTVNWLLDTKIHAVAAAYTVGMMGTIGIHVMSVDYGSFEETRVNALGFVGDNYNPGLTGRTFSAGAILIGISYARALTDRFAFGLTTNYIQEDLYLEKMHTTTFNFGMTYDSKVKSIKLGIALRNLGRKVIYSTEKNTIPQSMIIGFSGYLISDGQNLIMHSKNHRMNVVLDLIKARDDLQKYHVGLDYGIYNMFNLRAGYKFNYDTEGLTLGLGFITRYLSLDYAYNDLGDYWDPVHRFTVGISF